jgi:alcohol dehydrogenase
LVQDLPCFDFHPRTRIVFGPGFLDRLGELARELCGSRVLLVTDPGIEAAGHPERAIRSLEENGLQVSVFDGVIENPASKEVDACVLAARHHGTDLIVGLGGGSSMDTAKGCNFVLTNGGSIEDYWGIGKAARPMLPLIAVPTTAGTGSECQSFALISHPVTHQKMACGDPKAAPRIALLDPALTLTQPRGVAACTGMDAIAHAVETAVTTKRNPVSSLLSRESFRLTQQAFPRILDDPENMESRGAMLLGAALAGLAIENSMLGAAHAAANPLTARHGAIHGQAVALLLPHVVRFNAGDEAACRAYRDIAVASGLVPPEVSPGAAAETLAAWLESLLAKTSMPVRLADMDIPRADIPALAGLAAEQWTGKFNPRPLAVEDFTALYERAYG